MFGENVNGYVVPVLNEREVRAGAGILLFISLTVFWGAWHADILLPAQMMIIGFFIDFLIRVINPCYSPSLILGRIAVGHQTPEYTAAAPKRFAWLIGLVLATIMVITMIFMHDMSVVNFAICAVCIILLFLESSFGICLGCVVYNKILHQELTLCPGDSCEIRFKEPIQYVGWRQITTLVLFTVVMYGALHQMRLQNQAHAHHGPNHPLLHQLKGVMQSMPNTTAQPACTDETSEPVKPDNHDLHQHH